MARKVINRRVRYETEHAAQKREGHAFFPYAMFHDVVVNLMVVLIIVVMAVVWHATAGPINASHPTGSNGLLGPFYELKANPAVAQTEPRPEWYFLFLFELLRVFKQPWQLIFVHMWLVVKLGVTPWPARPPEPEPAPAYEPQPQQHLDAPVAVPVTAAAEQREVQEVGGD